MKQTEEKGKGGRKRTHLVKVYLNEVEKDLLDALGECKTFDESEGKSEANIPDSNEALPQINTDL